MVGTPVRLMEFQKRFIRDCYDNPHGTKRAILSMSRKNGKSTLIGCLVLAHLLVEGVAQQNSQIVVGAMSRDQARVLFNLVVKMINLSPELQALTRVKESKSEIIGLARNVTFRALASEAGTTHGLSPVLIILDEAGQIKGPRSEFVTALVTSQGAHAEPLMICISTQASDDADLLSLWIDDALQGNDPRLICHLHTTDPNAELDDPEGWRQSNPAMGQFLNVKELESLAAMAKRMTSFENSFRQYHLNQRVTAAAAFLSRSVWDSCNGPADYLDGLEVYGGLDLSVRTDLTAFVLIGKDRNGVWHVLPTFWTPAEGLMDRARRDRMPYDVWRDAGFLRTTPGRTVDYEIVVRDIAELIEGLDVRGIAFDRYRIDVLRKECERLGVTLPLQEFGQGFVSMAPALDAVEAEFLNGRVRHGGHPVLTMCAAGAVIAKDPAGNRKLDKSKSTARIDGMVGMAMAFGLANKCEAPEPQPEYQIFFL